MSDNNNNNSDAEAAVAPLSAEYFTELANCPPEEINNLLAQPNLDSTALAKANIDITPEQHLKYLKSCMTLSPVFSSQPIENENDACFTKLFVNIRNSVSALSYTQRHVITSCGILKEMQKVPLNAASVEFLQCCILASQYRYALHNMPSLNKEKDAMEYLRFHYLKGVIYYGNDLLQDALKEFNTVLQTPAMEISKVVIHAWKKLVLVKCTLDQKDVLKLPNGVSQAVSRYFKGYSNLESSVEVYKHLGEKYASMNMNQLENFLHHHSNELQADGNWGMIQRLASVLEKRVVHTTEHVYNCIPIERLAMKLHMSRDECVEYLTQVTMHQQRHMSSVSDETFVQFTVDDEDGVVYFDSNDKDHGLENSIHECMELVKKVKELDVKLASSNKYQMNVMKATSASEGKNGSESGEASKSVIDFS